MPPIRPQPYSHGTELSPLAGGSGRTGALYPPNNRANPNALSGSSFAGNAPHGLFGSHSRLIFHGNPTFIHDTHYHDHSNAITILYERSAPAAAYNSRERFDPLKCHENTRIGILNMIRSWANRHAATENVDLQADTPRLTWLYGSAGAGKSAIAQTTSEDLSLLCNLAASFFFSRTAPERSYRGDESRFVATIAHQLTEVMPGLRSYVENAIRNRPSVFDLTLSEQVMVLVMEPLRQVIHDHAEMDLALIFPKVIVVDGLDECKDEAGQKQVLEAIATLIGHPEIFPFSVFLASRPELAIRTWIASKKSVHPNLIRSVSLLDHCDSDHDIEVFVKAEVVEIRKEHLLGPEIPADWPSAEPIKELVKRASGQFVYVSTVMKYIKDPRNDPRQRLESILQNTTAESDRPYAELDALYLHILRQTQHPTLVHRILAFRLVTGLFCGILYELDPEDCLRNLLSLPLPVHMLLVDLQSIMKCSSDGMDLMNGSGKDYLGNEKMTSLSIPAVFHHASFVEFLLDRQRSEEFYVDTDKSDEDLVQIALKNIGDCASDPEEAYKSEAYVIFCFLIILQTRTSHRPFFLDQISVELSKWDTLNETMLYDILQRLAVKIYYVIDVRLLDIIDMKLWKHFAPAVDRRRTRCHQKLESAGLPRELFTISETKQDFSLEFRLRTESTNLWSESLEDFRDTSATPFGTGDDYEGFYNFIDALRDDMPEQEWAALQLERWDSEWDIGREFEDAVIFYLKHIVSLLDPSEDIHKPKEIIAAFDSLKEELGEHWRALTAAHLLIGPSNLVWVRCPISNGIVAALDVISSRFFPPHVISSIEDAALPFDFPYPQSKRDILNSFTSTCSFPRWFKSPWEESIHYISPSDRRHDLCYFHDYKRIYDICAHGGSGMIDLDDDDESMWSLSASHLVDKITNDGCKLGKRVGKFIWDYEEAEKKHKEMTKTMNSNNLKL